jgi:hypothetical protein
MSTLNQNDSLQGKNIVLLDTQNNAANQVINSGVNMGEKKDQIVERSASFVDMENTLDEPVSETLVRKLIIIRKEI